jgi:hypothetical protein
MALFLELVLYFIEEMIRMNVLLILTRRRHLRQLQNEPEIDSAILIANCGCSVYRICYTERRTPVIRNQRLSLETPNKK